jgi:hypothetical protein
MTTGILCRIERNVVNRRSVFQIHSLTMATIKLVGRGRFVHGPRPPRKTMETKMPRGSSPFAKKNKKEIVSFISIDVV